MSVALIFLGVFLVVGVLASIATASVAVYRADNPPPASSGDSPPANSYPVLDTVFKIDNTQGSTLKTTVVGTGSTFTLNFADSSSNPQGNSAITFPAVNRPGSSSTDDFAVYWYSTQNLYAKSLALPFLNQFLAIQNVENPSASVVTVSSNSGNVTVSVAGAPGATDNCGTIYVAVPTTPTNNVHITVTYSTNSGIQGFSRSPSGVVLTKMMASTVITDYYLISQSAAGFVFSASFASTFTSAPTFTYMLC